MSSQPRDVTPGEARAHTHTHMLRTYIHTQIYIHVTYI